MEQLTSSTPELLLGGMSRPPPPLCGAVFREDNS